MNVTIVSNIREVMTGLEDSVNANKGIVAAFFTDRRRPHVSGINDHAIVQIEKSGVDTLP